jgi:hypothetical protein
MMLSANEPCSLAVRQPGHHRVHNRSQTTAKSHKSGHKRLQSWSQQPVNEVIGEHL